MNLSRVPRQMLTAAVVAGLAMTAIAAGAVYAQSAPPQPDFALFYGTVQLDGENIDPEEQTVIAFVNGRSCGSATTFVADDDPGNPPDAIGKTVYTIQVMADGTGTFQRPGCGQPGAEVRFYFPEMRRMAPQIGTFIAVGTSTGTALNLTPGPQLEHVRAAPMMTMDGHP